MHFLSDAKLCGHSADQGSPRDFTIVIYRESSHSGRTGMKLPELLATFSKRGELRFLLIRGHAVIAHGYARTTFDVDLMICREQISAWITELRNLGYQLGNQAQAFAQFSAPPESEPVDLMLVNTATFEGMWAASKVIDLGGQTIRVPSLDHLLALKLHVLKQNLGHRVIKDLDDVIHLVLANHVQIESEHYKKLFERYGTLDEYYRVLKATGQP